MNEIRPCGNNEKWCESCVSKGKCNYTKNQDIIEEFEKIKAEIEQCYYNDSPSIDGVIVMKEDINNIFNKRIAELKGEQDNE